MCLCFGLPETAFGFLDALELFCLCFAQGLNSRYELLFCLLSTTTCFCFALAETGCSLLLPVDLSFFCFAQGLNSLSELLFCFCSLLRFCFGLAADGL